MLTTCPRPIKVMGEDMESASFFSFPLATEMFHFARCLSLRLCIQRRIIRLHRIGLPHSEIPGSQVACHLPETFRRLLRPSSAPRYQAIHRTPLRASAIQCSDCKIVGGMVETYVRFFITLTSWRLQSRRIEFMPCTYDLLSIPCG